MKKNSHCIESQSIPSILQLSSQSFSAISSSLAALVHVEGPQFLNTLWDRKRGEQNKFNLVFIMMRVLCVFDEVSAAICYVFYPNWIPIVTTTFFVWFWLYCTIDGCLCSLHWGLCERSDNFPCDKESKIHVPFDFCSHSSWMNGICFYISIWKPNEHRKWMFSSYQCTLTQLLLKMCIFVCYTATLTQRRTRV